MGQWELCPLITAACEGRTRIDVSVQPRASATEIVGLHGSSLKLRVAAPPADGRANRAVEELLAEALQMPRSSVRVVSGATGRGKRVVVAGGAPEAVARALDRVIASRSHEPG